MKKPFPAGTLLWNARERDVAIYGAREVIPDEVVWNLPAGSPVILLQDVHFVDSDYVHVMSPSGPGWVWQSHLGKKPAHEK